MELRAQTASFESIRMAEHKNMMQMPIAQMSVTDRFHSNMGKVDRPRQEPCDKSLFSVIIF